MSGLDILAVRIWEIFSTPSGQSCNGPKGEGWGDCRHSSLEVSSPLSVGLH